MPTVLSDSDHLSLNSLHSLHLPPLAPSSPPNRQFHHRRSLPPNFHPAYAAHAHYLHQDSYSDSVNTSPGYLGPSILLAHGKPHLARFPSSVSTPKVRNKRKARIPKHRYSNGPKWIHRHGLINGINYHWVETTNMNDDDGIKPTDKPLVVLLHGFPQFWYTWRHQIVPLGEAGYRVVAPDLRGFNLTDKPVASKRKGNSDDKAEAEEPANYDMQTLTKDIHALIQYLGHAEANIVGHDWGGIIAWAFAARFPQHTTKLVVMNAPHLCRWRDVVTDYTSASCVRQAWWTTWYTLCCQLLPSWIPESILSYHRSWALTHNMTSTPSAWAKSTSCVQSTIQDGFVCTSDAPRKAKGFPTPGVGGVGCTGCWKATDRDLYRDAISKPGAIYALLEYYRNLWLSVQQMEQYGKVNQDLPILVLWGKQDKTFPQEVYAQRYEEWIEHKDARQLDKPLSQTTSPASSVTVSLLDCGHFTPEEVPDEVNQNLLNFFQQPLPMLSAEL